MQDKTEVWQVQVNGQIYEATFQELTEWIAERSLLPTDIVRKKDLRWTQADRIPALQAYFAPENGRANPSPKNQLTPPALTPPLATPPKAIHENVKEPAFTAPTIDKGFDIPSAKVEQRATDLINVETQTESTLNFSNRVFSPVDACHFHRDIEAVYVCKQCDEKFCKGCPKAYGAVKICLLCGYFCETYSSTELAESGKAGKQKKGAVQNSRTSFDIFGTALAYPFKHPLSFILIALFSGALSLGANFGLLAALLCGIISSAIVFGCCTKVVEKVSKGNLDGNYVFSDENSSLGERILQPVLLGVAVYLVSWLPFALTSSLLANSVGDFAQMINRQNQPSVGSVFVFSVLAVVTGLWGLFYSPVAFTIAGSTQSFRATTNPLAGFNLIRRMGANFWKTFLMSVVLIVAAACLFFVVGIITAPFAAALGVGNQLAIFLNSIVWFYLYLVAACLFGYALYQSRDRMNSKF